MLAKRIIPCLDCDLGVAHGRVVKGVRFKQIRYAGIPWELAEEYDRQGADELIFLDITASHERRETMAKVIEKTSENVFMPLTVGGGIRELADARTAFNSGADKVSVNTAALKNPDLINDIAKYFGNQACVLAIDAKRRYGREPGREMVDTPDGECWFECSFYGGREFTGIDAIQWAIEAEERGAGDIMLTSMDRDGTKDGFDIELTKAISDSVNIPVIASGGCGNPEHILEVLRDTNASAALAASIFHFGEYTVGEVKECLRDGGVHVRM
ncbi:MAG: imidazole glycerol phosphate synthase subunit HisF [Candidatus Methanogaster sp.]|uniref:Imidazole glycerol phosphate synthase subunit HisF n=1 Tax=Candidatus Methanogaster sp. TaxID=3386292 RepID=A0AC61KYW3_9EURY|nr:MAG: imidazole glycerol phosphate synthase subunit HisF [ANME-2 cluster archaeon]